MKLLDLRKVRLLTKTSVAADKQPRIELPIFGITIDTEQSDGDTSKIDEKRAEWHDSDAPDANGKFRDLGINALADWLIKTRSGDARRIYGSINQQIVFNRNKNPAYAKKMERVREAVKRKLNAKNTNESLETLCEESFDAYVERLIKRHGINQIGKGYWGIVFQHPTHPDIVVKVYKGQDQDYTKYLNWCQRNQDNPYVPKIIDVHSHEYLDKRKGVGNRDVRYQSFFEIVFMEKLKPVSLAEYKRQLKNLGINDFIDTGNVEDLTYDAFEEAYQEGYMDVDLAKWWKFIRTMPEDRLDINHRNVMLRGKQLVFIDPLSN